MSATPIGVSAHNAKGTRGHTRNVLAYPQQAQVDAWVRQHYSTSGLDDTKAAEQATLTLTFLVGPAHIKYFRELHGIPTNYGRKRMEKAGAVPLALVAQLEEAIKKLHHRLSEHEQALAGLTHVVEYLSKDQQAFKLAMKLNKGPEDIATKLRRAAVEEAEGRRLSSAAEMPRKEA